MSLYPLPWIAARSLVMEDLWGRSTDDKQSGPKRATVDECVFQGSVLLEGDCFVGWLAGCYCLSTEIFDVDDRVLEAKTNKNSMRLRV